MDIKDPIAQFKDWFDTAKNTKAIIDASAMCLATCVDNIPSARMVLLKGVDTGFVFYTNLESRKGLELGANPNVALCFHWAPLERQVRIEGKAEPVSAEEADVYFASRPLESRIGAWSSKQSRPLSGRAELLQAVAANTAKFLGREVPRPPFWSGWRVVPQRIEFWEQGSFRLHERTLYIRAGNGWETSRLYP